MDSNSSSSCKDACLLNVYSAFPCCKPKNLDEEKQSLLATEHLGADANSFGQQTISTFGSFMLNINNIIGPAIVTLPLILQNSGWVIPLILFVAMQIMSAFSATMIAEAMQRIPGNQHFLRRFEFATSLKHYFGKPGFIVGQILINICLQANNIASIVVSAQVIDDFLVYTFGHSYALEYAPKFRFVSSHGSDTDSNPFDGGAWVISLGYIIAMAICIPFGFFNLDQNMYFQWFSFWGMMLCFAVFYIVFFLAGANALHEVQPKPKPKNDSIILYDYNLTSSSTALFSTYFPEVQFNTPSANHTIPNNGSLHWDTSRVPFVGSNLANQASVIGTIIFMSAFVTTVPSWVNEKMPHVSVNKSIWFSTITSNLLKITFGYLAAITYANRSKSDNILNVISRHAPRGGFGIFVRICVYMFNFATIIPGIPVFSILVRYNLVTGKVCPAWAANLIGVVAPWVLSMFFYHGQGLTAIVNWSAIIVQGFVNFAVPGILFYFALKKYSGFPEKVIEYESEDDAKTPSKESSTDEEVNPILNNNDSQIQYGTINGDITETVKNSEQENNGIDQIGDIKPNESEDDLSSDLDQDVNIEVNTKPGWFFANQGRRLYPVNSVPCKFCGNKFPLILSLGIAVIMTILTVGALIIDFYLLSKHQDVVNN